MSEDRYNAKTATMVYQLREHLDMLRNAVDSSREGHTKAALYKMADISELLGDLFAQLVEDGIHAGMSQAEIARTANIPTSALRGAKAEFSRSAPEAAMDEMLRVLP